MMEFLQCMTHISKPRIKTYYINSNSSNIKTQRIAQLVMPMNSMEQAASIQVSPLQQLRIPPLHPHSISNKQITIVTTHQTIILWGCNLAKTPIQVRVFIQHRNFNSNNNSSNKHLHCFRHMVMGKVIMVIERKT